MFSFASNPAADAHTAPSGRDSMPADQAITLTLKGHLNSDSHHTFLLSPGWPTAARHAQPLPHPIRQNLPDSTSDKAVNNSLWEVVPSGQDRRTVLLREDKDCVDPGVD